MSSTALPSFFRALLTRPWPVPASRAAETPYSQSRLRRERDERRRDRYIVDDELFYQATMASARSNYETVKNLREGVVILGPDTPAAIRLEKIACFLDFITESVTRAAEQAREVLHTGRATSSDNPPHQAQAMDG